MGTCCAACATFQAAPPPTPLSCVPLQAQVAICQRLDIDGVQEQDILQSFRVLACSSALAFGIAKATD